MADHNAVLKRLRAVCLALPETTEKLTWEETETFRVRDKIFAMLSHGYKDDGRPSLWCKALPGAQEVLVGFEPESRGLSGRPASRSHDGRAGRSVRSLKAGE